MKRFGMVAVALLLLARPSFASSITYFDTITNTDVATSVIGLRDLSGGDITISGVTGTVTHAYLFWHGPTNTTDTTINQNITFNGTNIVGTSLGLSHDNFWDVAPGQGTYANSQAYRADVTSLVQLDPDGTYSLSNMLNTPGLGLENGASLWVFYDDGDASNNRDVYMFNGNDGNWPNAYDEDGWDFTLTGFNYNGGTAYLDTFVSDGQTFVDSALLFNGTQVAPWVRYSRGSGRRRLAPSTRTGRSWTSTVTTSRRCCRSVRAACAFRRVRKRTPSASSSARSTFRARLRRSPSRARWCSSASASRHSASTAARNSTHGSLSPRWPRAAAGFFVANGESLIGCRR
ncbi:MAG: hypothetical protein QM736_27790 [Vicinamibacterales bacterium]